MLLSPKAETRAGKKKKRVKHKTQNVHFIQIQTLIKSTIMLHGHRVITNAQRNLIDTLNESGIPPSKIISVLSKESGSNYNVGCIPIDIQNYLVNKRRKLLQDGDV